MSKNNVSGWEALELYAANERKGTLGTIRKSSTRAKPDKYRPYGGRMMSVARLKAFGPTKQYTPVMNHDITG